MRRFILACLSVMLVSAAGPDPLLVDLQKRDQRIAAIGYALRARNAELCADKVPLSGFVLHDSNQYAPDWRAAARQTFFLRAGVPALLAVVPNSPAARAGLQVNDELYFANDTHLKPSATAKASDAPVAALDALLEREFAKGRTRLFYGRLELQHTAWLTPEPGCASRIQLLPGKKLNAWADGKTVQLTTALVDFAGDDDAIATIIAHEMAHNILGHRIARQTQGLKRKQAETQADYWGMYLIVRAGFDGDRSIAFWERFEAKTNKGLLGDGTHLSKKARLALARATLDEIRVKQRKGEALIPNPFAASSKR